MNTSKKSRISILIMTMVCIVAVIVSACSIGVLARNGSKQKKLWKQLEVGNLYLAEMDYERAVAAYEKAIKIDPNNTFAYMGLANAHIGMGDYEAAADALKKGKKKTDAKALKDYLDLVEEQMDGHGVSVAANADGADEPGASAESSVDMVREQLIAEHGVGINAGNVLPDFTVYDERGREVRIYDYAGKALYINFFTTWCPYCNYEVPDMQSISEKYGSDVQVIMIDLGESADLAEEYAREYNITFPIYQLQEWAIGDYTLEAVPVSIVVDPYGLIADMQVGMASYDWMDNAVSGAVAR